MLQLLKVVSPLRIWLLTICLHCILDTFGQPNVQLPAGHPFSYQGKYGLVDSDGNILMDPVYDVVPRLKHGEKYFLVKKTGKNAVARIDGKILVDFTDHAIRIDENLAVITDEKKRPPSLRIYDLEKEKLVLENDSLRFSHFFKSDPPLLVLNKNFDRNYLYSFAGEFIIDFRDGIWNVEIPYTKCSLFSSSYDLTAPDSLRFTKRYFDCTGTEMSPETFRQKYPVDKANLDNSLILTDKQSPTVFRNKPKIRSYFAGQSHPGFEDFKEEFPGYHIYSILELNMIVEGIVITKDFRKYQLAHPQGKIISPEYDEIRAETGYLEVREGANRGVMSIDGKLILPLRFLELDYTFNSLSPYEFQVATHSGYRGLATRDGRIFLPTAALEE